MSSAENVRRVRAELAKARRRGLHTVIVLGRTADWLLGTHLGLRDDPTIAYHQITHPSPLGLMGMAKRAGKGTSRVGDEGSVEEGFSPHAAKPASECVPSGSGRASWNEIGVQTATHEARVHSPLGIPAQANYVPPPRLEPGRARG